MWIGRLLRVLRDSELMLAEELRRAGERHAADPDVHRVSQTLAAQCEAHAERLVSVAGRFGEDLRGPYETGVLDGVLQTVRHMQSELVERTSSAGLLLLRDLRTLYVTACEVEVTWLLVHEAARTARDAELEQLAAECREETATQLQWLRTRLQEAAPQALVPDSGDSD